MNEDAIVDWLRKQTGKAAAQSSGRSRLRLGIGDDCAIVQPRPSEDLCFTTDQLIEGVHFERSLGPAKIGQRVLARNLSDLAAMGAEPIFCLVNVAVPRDTPSSFLKSFYGGLMKLASETGAELAGGDMAQSDTMHFDVTACGTVPRGKALRREGARPGDRIYVSGPLGKPWTRPIVPRLALGKKLRGRATACIDISDGISRDLYRLCLSSAVAAELESIPMVPGAVVDRALHGGEDYELLFTLPPNVRPPGGCMAVGRIVAGKPGSVRYDGRPLKPLGYDHFYGK